MNPRVKMTLTAVVTALVIGGGTYWYLNIKATTDKAALQTEISTLTAEKTVKQEANIDLQKQIDDLKKTASVSDVDLKKQLSNYGFENKELGNKVTFSHQAGFYGFPSQEVSFTLPDGVGASFSLSHYASWAASISVDFINYGKKAADAWLQRDETLNGSVSGNVLLGSTSNYLAILHRDNQASNDYTTLAGYQKILKDTYKKDMSSWGSSTVTVAGVKATRYTHGEPGGADIQIQFVKDGNYYEIGGHITGDISKDDTVTASIVKTLVVK